MFHHNLFPTLLFFGLKGSLYQILSELFKFIINIVPIIFEACNLR